MHFRSLFDVLLRRAKPLLTTRNIPQNVSAITRSHRHISENAIFTPRAAFVVVVCRDTRPADASGQTPPFPQIARQIAASTGRPDDGIASHFYFRTQTGDIPGRPCPAVEDGDGGQVATGRVDDVSWTGSVGRVPDP